MKKLSIFLIAVLLGSFNLCHAVKTVVVTPLVQSGIAKYKAQNYLGAMLDMQAALKKNPDDQMALYYLGNVYLKIGNKEEAKAVYKKIISSNQISGLVKYSTVAMECMDKDKDPAGKEIDKPACTAAKAAAMARDNDMDLFIRSGEFLHTDAKQKTQDGGLKGVQALINSGAKDIDFSEFRYLNDASGVINGINELDKTAAMPSDEEIANAVKTLAKVGFNPLTYSDTNAYNNPQLAQLNALVGGTNSGNSNMNMLPFLMAQGHEGNKINPQLMQSMMMNQLMPSYDFSPTSSRGF